MHNNFIRILSFILALVLIFSMAPVYADNEEKTNSLNTLEYVRVGLYWGTNSKSTVTLKSDSGFNLYEEDGSFVQYIDSTSLTMDTSSSYLLHKAGRIFMSAAADPDDRVITMTTNSGTKKYRDGIYLYENSGLRIINYVTLEHYVWGVVNREMSYSRPIEALKAQAVAARTYVMRAHYTRVHSTSLSGHYYYGFDVCATTDCQVYGGYESENEKSNQACIETAGQIMTYDGEPIYAYFSAASGGGYTMSLYDAWGQTDKPYLQSVSDPYTPEHNWKFTNTMEEIRAKIKKYYGKDIGTVTRFEVTEENSFGCATQITVTGSTSSVVIPSRQIMSVFNLKSTFFAVGNSAYPVITKIEAADSSSVSKLDTYYVLGADGTVEAVDSNTVYVYNGETVSPLQLQTESSSGNTPKYTKTNEVCTDMIYWIGIGFGHGIGMSQTGAYEMASEGFSYDSILRYYYTGVTIENYTNVISE